MEDLLKHKYEELELSKLERALNYEFQDKLLLVKALCHPSLKQQYAFKTYFAKQIYDFEKLEFIGDSVLGLAVIDLLLKTYANEAHGVLARFKNHLVSKKVVSSIASKLRLSEFWLMSHGEKQSGGEVNLSNFENALESLIGAIYIDCGDTKITTPIIQKLWQEEVRNIRNVSLDPKGSLQELAHIKNLGIPQYEVISSDNGLFTVRLSLNNMDAEGSAKSKKEAEVLAAQSLLSLLSVESNYKFKNAKKNLSNN